MLKTGELANDVGTVLFGEEAVRNGLIDELGDLSNALKKLYGLIDDMREGKYISESVCRSLILQKTGWSSPDF